MGTAYINFIADRVYNLLQRIQTGYSAINLSASVVRDNDAVKPPTSRSASELASENRCRRTSRQPFSRPPRSGSLSSKMAFHR